MLQALSGYQVLGSWLPHDGASHGRAAHGHRAFPSSSLKRCDTCKPSCGPEAPGLLTRRRNEVGTGQRRRPRRGQAAMGFVEGRVVHPREAEVKRAAQRPWWRAPGRRRRLGQPHLIAPAKCLQQPALLPHSCHHSTTSRAAVLLQDPGRCHLHLPGVGHPGTSVWRASQLRYGGPALSRFRWLILSFLAGCWMEVLCGDGWCKEQGGCWFWVGACVMDTMQWMKCTGDVWPPRWGAAPALTILRSARVPADCSACLLPHNPQPLRCSTGNTRVLNQRLRVRHRSVCLCSAGGHGHYGGDAGPDWRPAAADCGRGGADCAHLRLYVRLCKGAGRCVLCVSVLFRFCGV